MVIEKGSPTHGWSNSRLSGGTFHIDCNGKQIWERKRDGGFPEAKELKQRVRDEIDPQRDLGHNDKR